MTCLATTTPPRGACSRRASDIDAIGLQTHMHPGYRARTGCSGDRSTDSRASASTIHLTETTRALRGSDAARDRRPQRLPGPPRGRRTPAGEERQARGGSSGTTGRSSATRGPVRSPTGAWRIAAPGRALPRAWSAPTARPSPPTRPSERSSVTIGGSPRRRAHGRRGWIRCVAGSATTTSPRRVGPPGSALPGQSEVSVRPTVTSAVHLTT